MVLTLVGLEKVDYHSNKKNAQVKGVTAHFTYIDPDTDCEGVLTTNQYATEGSPLYDSIIQLKVGNKYEPQVEYNVKFNSARVTAYLPWDPIEISTPKK